MIQKASDRHEGSAINGVQAFDAHAPAAHQSQPARVAGAPPATASLIWTLPHRDRRDRRAGAALDLQRLHDEGELVDLLRRQLVELQVLEQVDAVHHQRDLVHRQRELLVGIGRDLDRPVVGAEQHRVLGSEPFAPP